MQTWIYGLVITSGAYLENVRSSEKCSVFDLLQNLTDLELDL